MAVGLSMIHFFTILMDGGNPKQSKQTDFQTKTFTDMIIKYNFAEVDTTSLDILAELKRGNSDVYFRYLDLFAIEEIDSGLCIAYRKSNKVLLFDTIVTKDVALAESCKQCMLIVLNKITGITTDSESIEQAFKIASDLGIKVSDFDFEAHEKDTLTVYYDDINNMYYVQ